MTTPVGELGDTEGCAIVAGASSGIGAASALAIGSMGIDVVAVSRTPQRLEEITNHLPTTFHSLAADMTEADDVERVFSHATASYGPVRWVIHSVGHEYEIGWFDDAEPQAIASAISALVTSPALVLSRAIRSMRQTGGTIGILTSGAANKATPGRALYSASKAAVNRLVESVAAECADRHPDLGVFAISPGRVATPMQQRLIRTADDAPEAFALAPFRSAENVVPAEAVGEAIASLVSWRPHDLNGRILRFGTGAWRVDSL